MIIIYLILILIIVLATIIFTYSKSGSKELVLNKTTYKNKHETLGYSDFKSFIDHKDLSMIRLICIIGEDKSGRTHLAKMISKKFGHKYIDERTDGKSLDAPKIREQFIIPAGSTKNEIQIGKTKKFIISGKFTDDELKRLFKGDSYNRNFLLLFVEPKVEPGAAFRWSKVTGLDKSNYDELVKNSKSLLKMHKKYRLYIIKNDFNQ